MNKPNVAVLVRLLRQDRAAGPEVVAIYLALLARLGVVELVDRTTASK